MKTTNYHCSKCGTTMKFQIRDLGRMPEVIGCKKPKCEGKSIEVPVYQSDMNNVDGVFFRPKTKIEWSAIQNQLTFEIKQDYKDISRRKAREMLRTVMDNLKKHVASGVLIQLPIAYFSKIKQPKSVD